MKYRSYIAVILASGLLASAGFAQSLDEVVGYLQYSDSFASAGQPTEAQLEMIRDAGFEQIVYIAFSSDGNAIANEDRLVRELGMDYVQIPVVWTSPTDDDFENFAAVMQRSPNKKTLLHCQVNFRASAFAFLYRVIHEGVPVAQAKADMNSVWEPNETWRELIFELLAANGISPDCEGCQW